jgi:monoterpene epsilon-lactone hydrolase
MNSTLQENRTWSTTHRISAEDETAMAALRAIAGSNKGRIEGTATRVPFDAIMERVAAPAGVTYEAGTVGGVSGWWCRPEDPKPGEAILHIHGGWFNWGSAQAFRHLVGHRCSHWRGNIRAGLSSRPGATLSRSFRRCPRDVLWSD